MTLFAAALLALALACNPYHDVLPRPACRGGRDCEVGERCRDGRCDRSAMVRVDVHVALNVAAGLPLTLKAWDAPAGPDREPLALVSLSPAAYPRAVLIQSLPYRRLRIDGTIEERPVAGGCGAVVLGSVETFPKPHGAKPVELWLARRAPRRCP